MKELINGLKLDLFLWLGRSLRFNEIDIHSNTDDDVTSVTFTNTKLGTFKQIKCLYCNGDCPKDEDHACDGYLGDIDNLYDQE